MTTPNKLNEFHHAEDPARVLLEKLGWTYLPRDTLFAERGGEREVLLDSILRSALLRLNEWLTVAQADRVIFELENINAVGMARNQAVHEYLTFGMPLRVEGPRGQDTRTVRFFDFDHPEGGLNDFMFTTQFRVRRGSERDGPEDDERLVIPDLVLFVNGIPLVVMEAKSPSLMDVWKTRAVRQLRRYQEAGPEWQGRGAPELFHYNLLCVAHCGAAAAYSTLHAPENAYFEWKSVAPHADDEVRQKFGVEPQGQAQLIVGMLSPATLLDILRDYVIYEPERGRLVKKVPRYQQYRAVRAALSRILSGEKPDERGGVVWHTQGSGKSLTMLWLATKIRRHPRLAASTIVTVTDRTQLDDQIANTFQRCGFPAPERIDRSRPAPEHLRQRRRARNPGQPDSPGPADRPPARRGPHPHDHHPEVRGGPGYPGRVDGRPERLGQRHHHGGRGPPDPVRAAGGQDGPGASQRGDGGLHGHAHRQGLPAEHDPPLRAPHRRLYHSRSRWKTGPRCASCTRPGCPTSASRAQGAWTSCSMPSSTRRAKRTGPASAAATPTGRPSRRRNSASR